MDGSGSCFGIVFRPQVIDRAVSLEGYLSDFEAEQPWGEQIPITCPRSGFLKSFHCIYYLIRSYSSGLVNLVRWRTGSFLVVPRDGQCSQIYNATAQGSWNHCLVPVQVREELSNPFFDTGSRRQAFMPWKYVRLRSAAERELGSSRAAGFRSHSSKLIPT